MSKYMFFDFRCNACSHEFEDFVKPEALASVNCPLCHGVTTRLVTAATIDPDLGLDAESFPTMGDKWAKKREQRRRVESRRMSLNEDY